MGVLKCAIGAHLEIVHVGIDYFWGATTHIGKAGANLRPINIKFAVGTAEA